MSLEQSVIDAAIKHRKAELAYEPYGENAVRGSAAILEAEEELEAAVDNLLTSASEEKLK